MELAKQLKELGVKQNSYWYWVQGGKYSDDWSESTLERENQVEDYDKDFICSAYTFAEISSMLPITFECNDDPYKSCERIYIQIYIQIGREKDGTWNCDDRNYYAKDKRIADAPAKMMIYLLSEDCYYDDLKFLKWKNSILNKRVMVKGIT